MLGIWCPFQKSIYSIRPHHCISTSFQYQDRDLLCKRPMDLPWVTWGREKGKSGSSMIESLSTLERVRPFSQARSGRVTCKYCSKHFEIDSQEAHLTRWVRRNEVRQNPQLASNWTSDGSGRSDQLHERGKIMGAMYTPLHHQCIAAKQRWTSECCRISRSWELSLRLVTRAYDLTKAY